MSTHSPVDGTVAVRTIEKMDFIHVVSHTNRINPLPLIQVLPRYAMCQRLIVKTSRWL